MEIVITDKFSKKYRKLSNGLKAKIDSVLEKFIKDPFDAALLNHGLQGRLKGFRSIKAGIDLRIIFREEEGYFLVVLIDLGKHDDVY